MIKKESLHIEYGVDVEYVYRRRKGSWLCEKWHQQCHFYNFVIWSPELKTSLDKFHPAHEEELDVFSRMEPVYFSTSIIDTLGVQRGLTAIDYMFSNVLNKVEHSVWAQRDSYAAINGQNGTAYQLGLLPTGKNN